MSANPFPANEPVLLGLVNEFQFIGTQAGKPVSDDSGSSESTNPK